MSDVFLSARAALIGFCYQYILRPVFFLSDAEKIHNRFVSFGQKLGQTKATRALSRTAFHYSHPSLKQKILGINFDNPIGLAAGFDKEANLTKIMDVVGFGFMEVGSITRGEYQGNQPPRLTRLKKSQALVVNYGLKSSGAENIAQKMSSQDSHLSIGTSIALTNSPKIKTIDDVIKDLSATFERFKDIGSFFVINTSCPNVTLDKTFFASENLDRLLSNIDKIPTQKPIFIKLSPDLKDGEFGAIIKIILKHRIQGMVLTNLTKDRRNQKIIDKNIPSVGGISGKPLGNLAEEKIKRSYQLTKGKLVIVGCGGVFNAEDAYRKIRLGASMIELITGMIYQGPQVIGQINQGIVKLLKRDGLESIKEAVGLDAK